MRTLLLTVDYTDGTSTNGKGEFWAESFIKNKTIQMMEGENIHNTVKRAIEDEDFAELSYNGKPQSEIFIDRNNEAIITGYIYRAKHFLSDRQNNYRGYALFNAWVTIREVKEPKLQLC